MNTKYFPVDYRRQGQIVEYFCTVSPDRDGPIFPQTLIVEAVYLGDLARLVVASY